MELITEWQDIGTIPAYTARPARETGPLPGLVVIQEVWGVDDHIEDLVQRFAMCGYLAVAPDLYAADGGRRPEPLAFERIERLKTFLDTAPPQVWRDPKARDAALDALGPAESTPLKETMGLILTPNRPIDHYTEVLVDAARLLRDDEHCDGHVCSTGYCFGGLLSARLAGADPDLSAAAIYYGAAASLTDMASLKCPLMGFYGADDTRITEQVPAFAEALHAAGHAFETHVYPDTPHAFFNDTRPSYRVVAARDAWARTLAFFAEALRH